MSGQMPVPNNGIQGLIQRHHDGSTNTEHHLAVNIPDHTGFIQLCTVKIIQCGGLCAVCGDTTAGAGQQINQTDEI